jgi:hypothetical protein
MSPLGLHTVRDESGIVPSAYWVEKDEEVLSLLTNCIVYLNDICERSHKMAQAQGGSLHLPSKLKIYKLLPHPLLGARYLSLATNVGVFVLKLDDGAASPPFLMAPQWARCTAKGFVQECALFRPSHEQTTTNFHLACLSLPVNGPAPQSSLSLGNRSVEPLELDVAELQKHEAELRSWWLRKGLPSEALWLSGKFVAYRDSSSVSIPAGAEVDIRKHPPPPQGRGRTNSNSGSSTKLDTAGLNLALESVSEDTFSASNSANVNVNVNANTNLRFGGLRPHPALHLSPSGQFLAMVWKDSSSYKLMRLPLSLVAPAEGPSHHWWSSMQSRMTGPDVDAAEVAVEVHSGNCMSFAWAHGSVAAAVPFMAVAATAAVLAERFAVVEPGPIVPVHASVVPTSRTRRSSSVGGRSRAKSKSEVEIQQMPHTLLLCEVAVDPSSGTAKVQALLPEVPLPKSVGMLTDLFGGMLLCACFEGPAAELTTTTDPAGQTQTAAASTTTSSTGQVSAEPASSFDSNPAQCVFLDWMPVPQDTTDTSESTNPKAGAASSHHRRKNSADTFALPDISEEGASPGEEVAMAAPAQKLGLTKLSPTLPRPDLLEWSACGSWCAMAIHAAEEGKVMVFHSRENFQHVVSVDLHATSMHWHHATACLADPTATPALFVCTNHSVQIIIPSQKGLGVAALDRNSALVFEVATTDGDRVRSSEREQHYHMERSMAASHLQPPVSLRPPGLMHIIKVVDGNLLLVDSALEIFKVSLCRPLLQFLLQVTSLPASDVAAYVSAVAAVAGSNNDGGASPATTTVGIQKIVQWAMAINPSQHDRLGELCMAVGRPALALKLPGLSRAFAFELCLELGLHSTAHDVLVKSGKGCLQIEASKDEQVNPTALRAALLFASHVHGGSTSLMLDALGLLCKIALEERLDTNAEVTAALLSKFDPKRGAPLHIEALLNRGRHGQALLVARRAGIADPSHILQSWNTVLAKERGAGWEVVQSKPAEKASVRSMFPAPSGQKSSRAAASKSGFKLAGPGGLKAPPPPGSSSFGGLKVPPPGASLGAAASRRRMKRTTTTMN